jgi:hypothetical protein
VSAGYSFLTTWVLDAPRPAVWEVLEDSERWPEWWDGVVQVDVLERGDEHRVGELARYRWRSRLPYDLAFDMRTVAADAPRYLEGRATGELDGTGRWWLFADGDTTAVVYAWDVRTTRRWMNAFGPALRPAFAWNHDWVMRRGGEGLARRLGARLLATA